MYRYVSYLNHLSIYKYKIYRLLVCSLWEILIQSRPQTII
jgi:hypothetical protein